MDGGKRRPYKVMKVVNVNVSHANESRNMRKRERAAVGNSEKESTNTQNKKTEPGRAEIAHWVPCPTLG